jgi:site-specific DNA-methyltransferase (adenine-specific)
MPEQLLGRIIRACSNRDELVLDPFAGSGTTLTTAKKLERRFVGFELSEQYSAQVKERLAAIQPGDPLDGSAEPLTSAPATADGRRLDQVGQNGSGRRRKRTSPDKEPRLPGL